MSKRRHPIHVTEFRIACSLGRLGWLKVAGGRDGQPTTPPMTPSHHSQFDPNTALSSEQGRKVMEIRASTGAGWRGAWTRPLPFTTKQSSSPRNARLSRGRACTSSTAFQGKSQGQRADRKSEEVGAMALYRNGALRRRPRHRMAPGDGDPSCWLCPVWRGSNTATYDGEMEGDVGGCEMQGAAGPRIH